jgi:hypothetical protein
LNGRVSWGDAAVFASWGLNGQGTAKATARRSRKAGSKPRTKRIKRMGSERQKGTQGTEGQEGIAKARECDSTKSAKV